MSLQHVRNVVFDNVNIEMTAPDEREKIYLKDVKDLNWK